MARKSGASGPSGARLPLMAGNWKMHENHLEAIALVQKLAFTLTAKDFEAVEVAVLPPFTALRSVQTLIDGDKLRLAYGAQDLSQQLTAYAACVRNHGLPNFYISQAGTAPPIPGSIREGASGLVIPPDTSPSAQKACHHLLPRRNLPTAGELHQQFIQALKTARCMRAHGYPTWPDPTVENGMVPNFIPTGIDTNSPQFNRAAKTCGAGP